MDQSQPDPRAIVGQRDASATPRYAGLTTFAHLPRLSDVGRADIAVLGVPFDSGVTYRPGARFGPEHIRGASRLLRPYNPALEVSPFTAVQVADAGDVPCTPFDIERALDQITRSIADLLDAGTRVVVLGGDHTIALASLRAMAAKFGRVAVVHFDAHLDTWDTYFDAANTHGTPFRRASEEGLLDLGACAHVGIRGSLYGPEDLFADAGLGFATIHCRELDTIGVAGAMQLVKQRVGSRPVYVSIDIDVLDPAHAPGTGTPEAGGMTSRELLEMVRGFRDLDVISADVVEVAPAYDHADITGVAAANVAFELISVMALRARADDASTERR